MTDIQVFQPKKPLNTPILFMVFNRLDTTKQVFEQIRIAKPPRLYIGADGARESKVGELQKVEEVRQYILDNIDWDCEVKTLFRDTNLGCKKAVSGAITWFFEHEPQGIILEDDCLPVQSFFWFCEEMLEYYKDDKRVWHISGDNFQNGIKRGDGSYYFSRYVHVLGWASWANRWQKYDVDLNNFDKFSQQNIIANIFDNPDEQNYWLNALQQTKDGKINTWDYQWAYCSFINNGLCVMPNVNMISNIGYGADATHAHDLESESANMKTSEIDMPIHHPSFQVIDTLADKLMSNRLANPSQKRSFTSRIARSISKRLKLLK